jgi:hypothetical protein
MAKQKPSLLKVHLPIQGYGLAVVSVGVALGIGLLLQRYSFHGVESLLFLFAIVLTVWFGGGGPAVLAVALASLAFNYFFTEPLTASTSELLSSRTILHSFCSRYFSPGSARSAAASSGSFCNPATNCRGKWLNEPNRPTCSI